jgi:hypothetical protein
VKAEIKHIDILTAVKICFFIYALIGLVGGLIMMFFTIAASGFADYGPGMGYWGMARWARAGIGVLMVPLFAIVYGCLGAIGALIVTLVYNVTANLIGGIKVTLRAEGTESGIHQGSSETEVRL